MHLDKIISSFKDTFGTPECIVRIPSRVNIIGEHTDYNQGYVLPFAADQYLYMAASKNNQQKIRISAMDIDKSGEIPIKEHPGQNRGWKRYFQQTIHVFLKNNLAPGGMDLTFGGNIPIGAGLSSSSAITTGFIFQLNELFSLGLSKRKIVDLASMAENSTGVEGGKMDQFTMVHGIQEHALFIDCKQYNHEEIPIPLEKYSFVLFDSGVQHNLASSEYNKRKRDGERAFKSVQQYDPSVSCFRDLTVEMIEIIKTPDPIGYQRLHHYISENERTVKAKLLLQAGNLAQLGVLLSGSHKSLDVDYQVSCPELNFLVEQSSKFEGFLGGRMMGGGFGGCTINLIDKDAIPDLHQALKNKYQKRFGKTLKMYIVKSVHGIQKI